MSERGPGGGGRGPQNAGSVKRRGEDSTPRRGRTGLKGSEAAEGEGAAKMASASSGPSSGGFSSADSGVPGCTSSSGNQGGAWAGGG